MNLCLRVVNSSCGPSKTHFSRAIRRSVKPSISSRRHYATHPNSQSGPTLRLSQTLDQRQRRSSSVNSDSSGPFQLGMAPAYASQQNFKQWKDLSTKGKVLRSTENTSHLAVVLVGAGLCCVLIYSLTSELFSPNSPTVLYADACDKIKASSRVRKYLHGNIAFHTEPPSSLRPRHRNRQVVSQVVIDSAGRDHMFLNFYISNTPPLAKDPHTYTDHIKVWWDSMKDMNAHEYMAWVRSQAHKTWDSAKGAVRFVSGTPGKNGSPSSSISVLDTPEVEQNDTRQGSSWVSGLFGSLRVATGGGGNIHVTNPELDSRTFLEAEVHVDFVRNPDGYFTYRYLVVDMPTSSARSNHVRLYVERAPGVSDREVVMR